MKRTDLASIVILLVLSVLPLLDLLHPGLPITHDGQDHVARIANFYQSLTEGNAVPRWAGNLNWGYGHPVVMFLYPLSSYIASLFHFLGFSLVDSTKLVFAAAYIASLFAMYAWLRALWGIAPALTGAVLYGFAPYRFVDLYVRGAIGEHVAFIFPPLIAFGLLQLARGKKGAPWWGMLIAISTAGLILSHNALSLMFLPIIILYAIYLYFFETKQKQYFILHISYFILLGFAVSAFYWIPAFFEGKYTLRDIVTKGEFRQRFVPLSWFLYSVWNYGGGDQFSKQVGTSAWFSVVLALVASFKTKQKSIRWLLVGGLLIFVISLYLMTSWSTPVWSWFPLLQKFQFPWRFLSLSVFISAFLGAAVVSQLTQRIKTIAAILIILVSLILAIPMWKAKQYQIYPETFFTSVYDGTTDTGESSPIWSVRFMEKGYGAPLEVVEGVARITQMLHRVNRHTYIVDASEKTRLVENTLYFPGWKVFVDGIPTAVEFQDPGYRGLMTFWVEPGEHVISVRFENTRVRTFANGMSLIGLVFLAGTATIPLWQRKPQNYR